MDEYAYDEFFMKEAITQAQIAKKHDEVPVGALIINNNTIISTGYNLRETHKNVLAHAENYSYQ